MAVSGEGQTRKDTQPPDPKDAETSRLKAAHLNALNCTIRGGGWW